MPYRRVQKSAHAPTAADLALDADEASLRVVDVAVDAAEFPEHPNPHFKVAIVLESAALDAAWLSATGSATRGTVRVGSASVMPAGMPYTTRWDGGGRMLLLSFSQAFIEARDAGLGADRCELRPAWSQADPLLKQLGLAVLEARKAGLASRSYLDAAAEVAMVHLLAHYGASKTKAAEPRSPPGLQRALDFIESRLGEELPLSSLACAAGMRPYGFAHAFAKAFGEPPHRYVIRRRCERARELLASSSMPIVEVAAMLGFSSQAHLTTAFAKRHGTTPARYRATMRGKPWR